MSERAYANVWDLLRRKPSRVGRGRRAAVLLGGSGAVCFGCGGSPVGFPSLERIRPTARINLIYHSSGTYLRGYIVIRTEYGV